MSLAIIHSRASSGINAPAVTVEAHISGGLPRFSIVGLPETAVQESKDRVRSALLTSHFEFPARRITVNLGPADLPKEGSRFDLPIALGILAATGQLSLPNCDDYEFAGELTLSGEMRPVPGMLPFALATRKIGRQLILPQMNADEAALAKGLKIFPAKHLLEVCAHLLKYQKLTEHIFTLPNQHNIDQPDMDEVCGQTHAKRGLEIAAAGGHSLLFIGPPGTGKTMLAARLPGILPELSDEEAIEVAAVNSICNKKFQLKNWRKRPFRAPHHTASSVALVGGGSPPRPGEISLAHHGVLFLDELPEFNRHVLEALREPLESGCITISRAARQAEFPARFQLIAAMNPCPCGNFGNPNQLCRCTPEQVQRYRSRLSGPLLDRIDMHIEVPPLPLNLLFEKNTRQENSEMVRERVTAARQRQLVRTGKSNCLLAGKELDDHATLTNDDKNFLQNALQKLKLSARASQRILRVARTIADLSANPTIQTPHLTEALNYRKLDRNINN